MAAIGLVALSQVFELLDHVRLFNVILLVIALSLALGPRSVASGEVTIPLSGGAIPTRKRLQDASGPGVRHGESTPQQGRGHPTRQPTETSD